MKTESLDLLERSQLSPDQSRAILQVMESELATKADVEKLGLLTKADVEKLGLLTKAEIEKLRLGTKADMEKLELGAKAEIEKLELRVELKIESLRTDLIKGLKGTLRWNFAFWVAQLAAIAGLIKYLK